MSEPGWVVDPREVPEALQEKFTPDPFAPPEPEPDEWLEIGKRLTDADLAALSKVFGIAAAILDNE
jgi:hypothetical protein